MTDTVAGCLITAVGGVIIAYLQRISKRLDGDLSDVKKQLATATSALLELTQKSSHAEGMKDEKDKPQRLRRGNPSKAGVNEPKIDQAKDDEQENPETAHAITERTSRGGNCVPAEAAKKHQDYQDDVEHGKTP